MALCYFRISLQASKLRTMGDECSHTEKSDVGIDTSMWDLPKVTTLVFRAAYLWSPAWIRGGSWFIQRPESSTWVHKRGEWCRGWGGASVPTVECLEEGEADISLPAGCVWAGETCVSPFCCSQRQLGKGSRVNLMCVLKNLGGVRVKESITCSSVEKSSSVGGWLWK